MGIFSLLVALPLIVLVVGWLLGCASIRRAIIFLFVWVVVCEITAVWALLSFNDPRGLIFALLAILLGTLGPLTATLFSFTAAPVEHPPIAIAAEVYDSLDATQKDVLHKRLRLGAKFIAKHGGNYLRDKGYARSADALQDGGHLI